MFTKEEYVQRYAAQVKSSVDKVLSKLAPVKCECEDPQCVGWAMITLADHVVLDPELVHGYIRVLRRLLTSPRNPAVGMVDGSVLATLLADLELQTAPKDVTVHEVGHVEETRRVEIDPLLLQREGVE